MRPRVELQAILEALLGSRNVYFQPPENLQMVYPCIVYNRDFSLTQFADNGPYRRTRRYSLTVIDRDPDSLIRDKVENLPMCTFARHYKADNLNHDVYDLYF